MLPADAPSVHQILGRAVGKSVERRHRMALRCCRTESSGEGRAVVHRV